MVIMKKINLYSNEIQLTIRIISLFAIIIVIISNTKKVESLGLEELLNSSLELFAFIVNCISTVLFFLLTLFPTKLEILSLVSFFYGASIILFEPKNNIGILMYCLSLTTLYSRGAFNKYKKIKEIIFSILFFVLILSELRFGKDIFFSCLLEKTAYSFILFLCLFFLQAYTFDIFETNSVNYRLDIQKYPELKKRDAEWLVDIINGEKYEVLAINYHMSLGSVKNRIKVIFDELGVGDKQGFLNKYSDYEICYGDDFSSIKKKKKLFNINHQN